MKTILITGGAGYVGSSLVRLLLDNEFKVIAFDNLTFGSKSLEGVLNNLNFKFVKGDITVSAELEDVFANNKIDAVVHMAAIVGDPACSKNPKLAEEVNLRGAVHLLEIAKKNRIEKFVFISTCSNYGKMSSKDGYVNETSLLAPISLYAKLKVEFEKILLENDKEEGFCPTVLRFATAYGISYRMRFDLTVNEFVKELALKRELEVFGRQFWRPYCHVSDLARAVVLALNADKGKVAYRVFNVGDTKENFQKQMIVDEVSKKIPNSIIKYVHRDEDPRDYRVSFEKIKNELGFKITKRLADGIEEMKEAIENNIFLNPDDKKYQNC